MTGLIRKTVAGRYSLDDLKPSIKSDRILFPVSVEQIYVEEDGRSFSYPVDEGWVTEIKYDFVMGVLADDTIDLAQSLKNRPQSPSCGMYAIDEFEWTEEQRSAWMVGLDLTWLDTNYEELLDKSSVVKEDWIKDQLENYWCLPTEWRAAYDRHITLLNTPTGSKTVVLVFDELTLFKDESGDYFFQTKYFCHGRLTKADRCSAEEYIIDFKEYEVEKTRYQASVRKLAENLALLKASLVEVT